jgi:hypothetical protein
MDNDGIDVIGQIKQLEQQKLASGEIVRTPRSTFNFSYMSEERYRASSVKGLPESLNLNQQIIEVSQTTLDMLDIEGEVKITVRLKGEDDGVELIPSLGIGGKRISGNEIEVVFDPDNTGVSEGIQKWIVNLPPHELNHVARFQRGASGHSLLDAIVREGLACYQEKDNKAQPEKSPWSSALTHEQEREEWQKALPVLDGQEFKQEDWFFGKDNKHPAWTGYSLGTRIAEEYFRNNPGKTMKDCIGLSGRQILMDSQYGLS